jgi:hypothetical protein
METSTPIKGVKYRDSCIHDGKTVSSFKTVEELMGSWEMLAMKLSSARDFIKILSNKEKEQIENEAKKIINKSIAYDKLPFFCKFL